MDKRKKLLIISDFNTDNLSACFNTDQSSGGISAISAPFGQAAQVMLDGSHSCWDAVHSAVVWTLPGGAIEGIRRRMLGEPVSLQEILTQVDQWCGLLQSAAKKVNALFVPSWTLPAWERGLGFIDLKHEQGVSAALLKMNARLLENTVTVSNIYPLDAGRWARGVQDLSAEAKLWYLGKIPFSNSVFIAAAREIKAAIQSLSGAGRKLVVLDLDDTLWGGIVGDDGIEGIKLGGHDPVGEAFLDFQAGLKALSRRGILLAIVSKNEEPVALNALENHPEMLLRKDAFSSWRINWKDKAANIVEIARELNLGLQSIVFIDDNPAERDRVKEALPEVFVPDWPKDKTQYTAVLKNLTCFDQPALSEEDIHRSRLYAVDRERKSNQLSYTSIDDWLKTLDVVVVCESLNSRNLQRTVQLLNKTNQMNLTTRRLTEQELKDWLADDRHRMWTFRVSDKFGDLGLTGVCSIQVQDRAAVIEDFVLSCRVMGRKIEEVMLTVLSWYLHEKGVFRLEAQHISTSKNKPCLDFFQKTMEPVPSAEDRFVLDIHELPVLPDSITLVYEPPHV